MSHLIRKAVFPVAGMGTRFLPATKASPKEMLPIVDKPLIQYAVEEAIEAGVEVLVFVNGRNKRAIPDHFDKAYELEDELERKGKKDLLEIVTNIIPSHVTCVYVRQAQALGLGHAVLCAQPVIGDEPFAVMLADDLVVNDRVGCLGQMAEVHQYYHSSILGVQKVEGEDISKYGVVGIQPVEDKVSRVEEIVEKPAFEDAPSDLGVVGRYILTPQIFDKIRGTGRGAGGEIQLTDAIGALMDDQQVLTYQFEGKRYDCGSKIGYLMANIELGLKHHQVKDELREYLKTLEL